jgi:glycosyltransferase involved in cell wall biosynthesis
MLHRPLGREPVARQSVGAKILVISSEIRNPHHRGIFFYKRSLLAALKEIGFTVGLLTQAAIPRDLLRLESPIVRRREAIHSLAHPTTFEHRRARKAWMKSDYKRCACEIPNRDVMYDPQWSFLADVDYFFNAPWFFDVIDYAGSARLARYSRGWVGTVKDGAIDIDFVKSAGYRLVITPSPTPIRSISGQVTVIQSLLDLIPLEYPFGEDDVRKFILQSSAALSHADHVVTISEHTALALRAFLPEQAGKCAVIYPPNPLEPLLKRFGNGSFTEDYWLKKSGAEKSSYFLYIGALEKRKNVEVLIRAFSMLPPGFKLLLAGPASEGYLQQLRLAKPLVAGEPRADGLMYLGYISEEEKVALLRNAAALVFPSVLEGFGLPVLEAMSVACPVITTRCGSLPEVGGDAVLYLKDPYDVMELADLMKAVANDGPQAATLRERGLTRAKNFSAATYAEALRRWFLSIGVLSQQLHRPAAGFGQSDI